jgi:predicted metalloprotease
MKWRGERQSDRVEVRRGPSRGGAAVGGIGAVILVVLGLLFGVDVTPLLQGGGGGGAPVQTGEMTERDREATAFVATVLAYTEDAWTPIFRSQVREPYQPAALVDFRGQVDTACGAAGAASGPFYCPGDSTVYIDTEFFTTLNRELGAKGDFAAAYVVGHEVAHHVQNLLGILSRVNDLRRRVSEPESNALSVRIELQADCLSGIWARALEDRLGKIEPGDIAEAVNAARQIGDDVLQARAGQRPQPHMFTHGTADQRARWFLTGYKTGRIDACNTLDAPRL